MHAPGVWAAANLFDDVRGARRRTIPGYYDGKESPPHRGKSPATWKESPPRDRFGNPEKGGAADGGGGGGGEAEGAQGVGVVGFAEFIELLVLCACWRAPP